MFSANRKNSLWDDFEINAGKLVKYNGNDEDVVIPDNVTEIGDAAFNHKECLKTVKIPEGVTVIGMGAFADCKNLTSVTIPEGVTEIKSGAF